MTLPTAQNTMQGVVLPGNRGLEYRDYPIPTPGPGQVLVRIKASSLCGSDLRAIYRPTDQGHGPEAYQGVIAGHEPCGVLESVAPDVTEFKAGDRVVIYHIAGCGVCDECRSGFMISCSSERRAVYAGRATHPGAPTRRADFRGRGHRGLRLWYGLRGL